MYTVQYYKEILRAPWDTGQRRKEFETLREAQLFVEQLEKDDAEYIKILKPKQDYD